mmetsp:Transcript_45659/g.85291  ORF Transcript_45659/g.85291 Transcript_45659/m.85291 type:complete len:223 (+) Transcript_45659:577-1245(+)
MNDDVLWLQSAWNGTICFLVSDHLFGRNLFVLVHSPLRNHALRNELVQVSPGETIQDSLRARQVRISRVFDAAQESVVHANEIIHVCNAVGVHPSPHVVRRHHGVHDHVLHRFRLLVRVHSLVHALAVVKQLAQLAVVPLLITDLGVDDPLALDNAIEVHADRHVTILGVPHQVIELVYIHAVAPVGYDLMQEGLLLVLAWAAAAVVQARYNHVANAPSEVI